MSSVETTAGLHETASTCRSCAGTELEVFLDLGVTPLADRLLTDASLQEPEPAYPLDVAFCHNCGLVQILKTVPPDEVFSADYPYYSSFSPYLLQHSRNNVQELVRMRGLDASSFVVELASNDGYLLKNYVDLGIPVLGIDPAPGPARSAEEIGVPTMVDFFTCDLAERLRGEGRQADVIHANNVLAHVADTNGFVDGIRTLLKPDGVAVIEAPYLRDLIDHCEFDTIYHEHLCYFSVNALDALFRRHELYLNDVRWLPIHGGSLRLYVEPRERPGPSVREFLHTERELNLTQADFYRGFSRRVHQLKDELTRMLRDLKRDGFRIAAYGAAAKGSTLINYMGIGTDLIDFVVDRNIHKQCLYMPGQHIPIRAPEALLEEMPDYVLLLAWNFADEILEQHAEFRGRGGRFIIPVPQPRIV